MPSLQISSEYISLSLFLTALFQIVHSAFISIELQEIRVFSWKSFHFFTYNRYIFDLQHASSKPMQDFDQLQLFHRDVADLLLRVYIKTNMYAFHIAEMDIKICLVRSKGSVVQDKWCKRDRVRKNTPSVADIIGCASIHKPFFVYWRQKCLNFISTELFSSVFVQDSTHTA